MLRIALTGGIASGKSAASDAFAALGVPIIDADVLAREAVAPGSEGLVALSETFGEGILDEDGALDRAELRRIIFNDPNAREAVNAVLHPLIRRLGEERTRVIAEQPHPYLIHAIPLLVESKQADRFDRVLLVDVPETLQIERLQKRDNSSEADARRILAAQASRAERLAIADDVIVNDGTLASLEAAVAALHERYLQLAAE